MFAAIVGAVAFFVLSQIPPVYRSEASVIIEDGNGAGAGSGDDTPVPIANQVQLVRSPDLGRRVLARLSSGVVDTQPATGNSFPWVSGLLAWFGVDGGPSAQSDVARALDRYFRSLEVSPTSDSRRIVIGFSSTDPQRAADAANAIAEEFVALQRDARSAGVDAGDIRIMSAATVPAASRSPWVVATSAVAAAIAFSLGALTLLLRAWVRRRSVPRTAFTEPLPVVPNAVAVEGRLRFPAADRGRQAASAEPTLAPPGGLESERSLARIAGQIATAPKRRVLVTSTDGTRDGDGSHAAVALARALARTDGRVVLVNLRGDHADDQAMGAGKDLPGVTDLLTGGACFAQAISRDRDSRAHLIPAGRHPPSAELFDGERLATILDALDETYDHLVLDARDDLIAVVGKSVDIAMVATTYAAADPRTTRAFDRVAAVSSAPILFLMVEPATRPSAMAHSAAA